MSVSWWLTMIGLSFEMNLPWNSVVGEMGVWGWRMDLGLDLLQSGVVVLVDLEPIDRLQELRRFFKFESTIILKVLIRNYNRSQSENKMTLIILHLNEKTCKYSIVSQNILSVCYSIVKLFLKLSKRFSFFILTFFQKVKIWLEESATDGNSNSYFSVFSVWWVESDPLLSIALRKSLPSFCPGTGLMDGGGWPRGSGRDPSKSLTTKIQVLKSICCYEIEIWWWK